MALQMVTRNFRSIYTATKKLCHAVTVTRTSVSLLDELQAQDLEPDLIFWTSLGDAYSSLIFFGRFLARFWPFFFGFLSLSLSSKIIQGDLYFVWDNLCLFGHPSSLCLAQREGLPCQPDFLIAGFAGKWQHALWALLQERSLEVTWNFPNNKLKSILPSTCSGVIKLPFFFGGSNTIYISMTRWWFHFFKDIFTPIWGTFPIWLIYFKFSDGLNQPTSTNLWYFWGNSPIKSCIKFGLVSYFMTSDVERRFSSPWLFRGFVGDDKLPSFYGDYNKPL